MLRRGNEVKRKTCVIGGGFFGNYIAEYLALEGHEIVVLEKEADCMTRASYNNQARVHNGYHYPRSILTAYRSRVSFPRFVEEFRDCIDGSFKKYYLVGRILGKVTALQFERFCERIGAFCEPAPSSFRKLVNPALIEACYSAVEYVFDARKLRATMKARMSAAGVAVRLSAEAAGVRKKDGGLEVSWRESGKDGLLTDYFDEVFNCTYSGLNLINRRSALEVIPLKHQITEMALVEVPGELMQVGITVVCGPYFSIMPFPDRRLHTLSHVRYTPHYEWADSAQNGCRDPYKELAGYCKASAWEHMVKDASRYIPILRECCYRDSLWEIKTILPRSDTDDSRPILFRPHHGLRGYHCVLGGKIDNVYDVIDALRGGGT